MVWMTSPCKSSCGITRARSSRRRRDEPIEMERKMIKKILLVGESWVSSATHYKGFDQFGSVTFHLGAEPLVKALAGSPFELRYMPAHEAATDFPLTLD